MSENEELKKEVEELRKIVEDLKTGSIRIESNISKLHRLKQEIVNELLKDEKEPYTIWRVRRFAGEFALDIFDDKYPMQERKLHIKTANRIFGYPDEEERLQYYLETYKQCIKFVIDMTRKSREDAII